MTSIAYYSNELRVLDLHEKLLFFVIVYVTTMWNFTLFMQLFRDHICIRIVVSETIRNPSDANLEWDHDEAFHEVQAHQIFEVFNVR